MPAPIAWEGLDKFEPDGEAAVTLNRSGFSISPSLFSSTKKSDSVGLVHNSLHLSISVQLGSYNLHDLPSFLSFVQLDPFSKWFLLLASLVLFIGVLVVAPAPCSFPMVTSQPPSAFVFIWICSFTAETTVAIWVVVIVIRIVATAFLIIHIQWIVVLGVLLFLPLFYDIFDSLWNGLWNGVRIIFVIFLTPANNLLANVTFVTTNIDIICDIDDNGLLLLREAL